MTHTARLSVVTKRLQDYLTEKVGDSSFCDPPIARVYYGDQMKIPEVPSICLEPASKSREWPPKPHLMTVNLLEVQIFVYHQQVDQENEDVKFTADLTAELVEEYVNTLTLLPDAAGEPLVIHSNIVEHEPGYMRKEGSMFHGSRLLWRGLSKTQLLVAG